jgi:hypothetical protein
VASPIPTVAAAALPGIKVEKEDIQRAPQQGDQGSRGAATNGALPYMPWEGGSSGVSQQLEQQHQQQQQQQRQSDDDDSSEDMATMFLELLQAGSGHEAINSWAEQHQEQEQKQQVPGVPLEHATSAGAGAGGGAGAGAGAKQPLQSKVTASAAVAAALTGLPGVPALPAPSSTSVAAAPAPAAAARSDSKEVKHAAVAGAAVPAEVAAEGGDRQVQVFVSVYDMSAADPSEVSRVVVKSLGLKGLAQELYAALEVSWSLVPYT